MEKILDKVIWKITPTREEIVREKKFAEKIIGAIGSVRGKHLRAELVGSMARNTHLRGDNDLDIFVFFPENLSREEFEKEGLHTAMSVFRGHKWEKAYSEHPYIRGKINGFEVEIVPAYDVASAENLKSAVDRSAFHNKYLLREMKPGHEREIRLLKQFMKGVKCYGADLSTNSFPGYVAEILVLKYGSFANTLKAASGWKPGEVVDVEGHLGAEEARGKFGSHFVVIDPVDRNRNVAAALSQNQYARFIAAARAFLQKPSMNFFFPKPHRAWSVEKLKRFLRKTELVAIATGYPKGIVEDIMWGQLRRVGRKMAAMCEAQGFAVKRSAEWLEHARHMFILLEVESTQLQKAKILRGPEATDRMNSEAFLRAHPNPLSGPRIENSRWVLEVERKYTHVEPFIKDALKKLKTEEKGGIRKALNKRAKIMHENEIIALYRKNAGFRQFLTGYLKGEEEFLGY
ncbi:MAG: CCA tRNA nucleotidyltransferase [Candidatus Diapherotrites archaeon]|uniref:CCA-adding enzyme n=1 Tax=Candidatus Iainarchaeum sp. TaxID=3101447 RepID=A0A8T3YJS2_9ARCH|nr:CCA tRNA nucleotidyltransferase [Candidatus Diapherotrites archaeon]